MITGYYVRIKHAMWLGHVTNEERSFDNEAYNGLKYL